MEGELEKLKPGLAYSPLTEKCYFVHSWNADGSAKRKTDVTEDVKKIINFDWRKPSNGRSCAAFEVPLEEMFGIWIELRATVQIFGPRFENDYGKQIAAAVRADDLEKARELIMPVMSINTEIPFSMMEASIDGMFIEEMME